MKIDTRNVRAYVNQCAALNSLRAETVTPDGGYQRLRRLEMKARRMAEAECNGTLPEGAWEKFVETTTRTIERIFGGPVPGFFVNSDPRGYALKIDPSHGKVPEGMSTDWGGCGILAPEF
jgi:hypothetical protein